jgi:hypothetical protein
MAPLNAIVLALSVCIAALLCTYQVRRRRIAEFARRVTRNSHSQRDAAFALARVIFGGVKRARRDPVFLVPILRQLGGSPTTILKEGGCCSGVQRLFITALDTIGIRAAQITVYRRADPAAAHCLAQVRVEGENIIIDADYGVWLRRPDGQPIDLSALRAGLVPTIEPFALECEAPFAEVRSDGKRSRPAGYPDREYYRYDFGLTRTANWAETRLKRIVYALLHPLTRGRVDCLLLPPILEWPEILLATALCFAAVGLLAAAAIAQA